MEESDQLLLLEDEAFTRADRGVDGEPFNESVTAIPVQILGIADEYIKKVIEDVEHENRGFLLKIHEYYCAIIKELRTNISRLEIELSQSYDHLARLQKQPHIKPQTPFRRNSGEKFENCSPVTIDFHFEDEELLLHDQYLENKAAFITPTLTESIVFNDIDEQPTKKKEARKSHRFNPLPYLQFEEFDSPKTQQQQKGKGNGNGWQDELKGIKQELRLIRSCLQLEGININAFLPIEGLDNIYEIKVLQVQQSKNVKAHLSNENLKLRERNQLYKNQLQVLQSELLTLKQQLSIMLNSEGL